VKKETRALHTTTEKSFSCTKVREQSHARQEDRETGQGKGTNDTYLKAAGKRKMCFKRNGERKTRPWGGFGPKKPLKGRSRRGRDPKKKENSSRNILQRPTGKISIQKETAREELCKRGGASVPPDLPRRAGRNTLSTKKDRGDSQGGRLA